MARHAAAEKTQPELVEELTTVTQTIITIVAVMLLPESSGFKSLRVHSFPQGSGVKTIVFRLEIENFDVKRISLSQNLQN